PRAPDLLLRRLLLAGAGGPGSPDALRRPDDPPEAPSRTPPALGRELAVRIRVARAAIAAAARGGDGDVRARASHDPRARLASSGAVDRAAPGLRRAAGGQRLATSGCHHAVRNGEGSAQDHRFAPPRRTATAGPRRRDGRRRLAD